MLKLPFPCHRKQAEWVALCFQQKRMYNINSIGSMKDISYLLRRITSLFFRDFFQFLEIPTLKTKLTE